MRLAREEEVFIVILKLPVLVYAPTDFRLSILDRPTIPSHKDLRTKNQDMVYSYTS